MLALDAIPQISLFLKLKLVICARAGNRAGLFRVRDPSPERFPGRRFFQPV
jgi:hypothetical protein